ncbi:hypothetical protein HMPREF9455_02495 [Dysgonomonas gadei ATCC BAA-286]|uniref:Uncharacterized protein n=1 Tax=Dysgonomonas gadei ATCC BAA-286 TaxID=742766 RepID=F5IZH8_9BACT|nr:hypothetical protein HMPREF9455_02495 [Dysgonomonas gadei ATCC BAA-286]
MFILALPKTNQKASAPFLGDPQPICRLKVTNGLSPRPFAPCGCPACVTNAQGLTHVGLKHENTLSCRRIAIPASFHRRGTQSVKRRCRAK